MQGEVHIHIIWEFSQTIVSFCLALASNLKMILLDALSVPVILIIENNFHHMSSLSNILPSACESILRCRSGSFWIVNIHQLLSFLSLHENYFSCQMCALEVIIHLLMIYASKTPFILPAFINVIDCSLI